MSIKRSGLVASIAVLGMMTATSSAFAEGGRRYGGWDNGSKHHRTEPAPHYRGGNNHGGYAQHSAKKRDNTAKIAILGMSAIILGAILSQASRDRRGNFDD